MTITTWLRAALGYLMLVSLQVGVWALVAPRSFYDDFPGLGRSWVAVDGPYNEHLIRDVGALNLALLVLLGTAAVTLSRRMVVTAAIASLVWGIPHLIYHIFSTERLESADVVASIGALVLFAGLPVAMILMARRLPATQGTSGASS